MNKRLTSFHRLALSTVSSLLVLHSAVSFADDTEIFFGGSAIDDSVRPNVLFILDNSGSMQWRTASNNDPSGSEKSRMQILKESFSSIISNAGTINAGIMVLNARSQYASTRMVYPVTNIDNTLDDTVPVLSTPTIQLSGDDATQRTDIISNASINDSTLLMGKIGNTTIVPLTPFKQLLSNDAFFIKPSNGQDYTCRMNKPNRPNNPICTNNSTNDINIGSGSNSYVTPIRATSLLYFRDLINTDGSTIPATAASDPSFSAVLELRPSTTNTIKPAIQIQIERSKTPGALNDNNTIGSRVFLPTIIATPDSWNSSQGSQIDITQVIKDLMNIDGLPLKDVLISLRASNSGNYTFCARNCTYVPSIKIKYTKTATTFETRTGALRFQDVGIPQGATVTSARINFAPASTSTDDITFTVKAEKPADGDADVFTASNIVSRPKTTALTTWVPDAWTNASPPVHIDGPDVTQQVRELVNLSSWCGNNAMAFFIEPTVGSGTRIAHSIDGAPGLQPTLTVTYSGGSGGCLNPIIEASINKPKNDAYQLENGSVTLGGNTLPITGNRLAGRFEGIPIVNAGTVLDAKLLLTPANTVSGSSLTASISLEDASNSAALAIDNNNLSGRTLTSAQSCTLDDWTTAIPAVCGGTNLTAAVQRVVNKASWTPGNAITAVVVPSANSTLETQAYESNPAESLKLRIKVRSGDLISSNYTVRQHLNSLVQAMYSGDGTPIVPTMSEAASYLRGSRSGFDSPITSACQTTHLVVLTDGQANGNGAQTAIKNLTGATCTGDATDTNEQCGRSLAKWMGITDQSSDTGDNFITTHTIGFALGANTQAKKFLSDMSLEGKGGAYTAENASQLTEAFNKILQDVLSVDTTFVSPGATVNQFNRQSNKNEVYFALFKPSDKDRWIGNLKRYALNSQSGDIILDADNVGAINASTGFFKDTARSFWTTGDDGNNTALGGVAKQLPIAGSRKAYTYLGSSPASEVNLNASNYLLKNENTGISNTALGVADNTERLALINWLRGDDGGQPRGAIGDPLHSIPRLVTYKCNTFTDATMTACSSEEQSVFIGTNEGFVHAFDTRTGIEQMAFMPGELLGNIKALKANEQSTTNKPRKYGMDNTVVTWANDANGNGVIYGGRNPSNPSVPLSGLNTGEFVYAYATMGRGGRSLYSLNVTDIASPKMRWYITPSTPGFTKLGQTWSTPVVTKIKVGSVDTPVLVFAGGYDEEQDKIEILNRNKAEGSTPESNRAEDRHGNSLYIVNALTGQLIWSAGTASSNSPALAHQQLTKMRYSMPSSVRVIDINRDGLADQFFVGDMGGQVWRFFINNGNTVDSLISPLDSGTGTTDNGVFANIIETDSGTETPTQKQAKLRRFYNEPDVALLTVNAGKSLVVNIGSGYRGHPLATSTDDRFYSFRTPLINTNAPHTIITESNMYDATLNLLQEGSASEKTAAAADFAKSYGGWYIRLENDGEKVLSEATTFAGKIYFNTYEPNSQSANSSCKAVQGTGRSYATNLFDATPVEQRINGTPERADRVKILNTAGIPPKGITLFPEGKDKAPLCIGTECEDLDTDISVGPTYWIDEQ